jgi:hypothetical protein
LWCNFFLSLISFFISAIFHYFFFLFRFSLSLFLILSFSFPFIFYFTFAFPLPVFLGFLQGVTSISIVPKHILISKLSSAIQLRQYCKNNNNNNNNSANNNSKDKKNKENEKYTIITLHPGQVRNFHFPSKVNEKILQIRKFEKKKSDFRSGENSPKERNIGENDNSDFCDDDDSDAEEEGRKNFLFLFLYFLILFKIESAQKFYSFANSFFLFYVF